MQLYLDDKYDYSNGTFTGMSDETTKQFKKDLKTFYTAFTGIETMPPEINKFSDIKLKDYQSKSGCQGDNPLFKQTYNISKNDKLFIKYASNIKKMISTAASKQSELLSIINNLFTFVEDPYTKKKKIRINPKLTDNSLQNDIVKARKIIVELYVNCETDYVEGLKIYEAIVEKKIIETTQKQINTLQKESDKIITETKNNINPVVEPNIQPNVGLNNNINEQPQTI
jgi:ribosomal protein L17